MAHLLSPADRMFLADVESGALPVQDFDHRAHLRLAYICLAGTGTEDAYRALRATLRDFLDHHSVDPAKYHETITRAWILAVRHFMTRTPATDSAAAFIEANPELLDSKAMMTHYSAERLFSDEARRAFVEPDRDPIPQDDSAAESGNASPRRQD